VDPRTRRQLLRYGAPAAFLAAVTIAVLLVKAGLSGGDTGTTTGGLPTTAPTTTAATTTTKLVLTGTTGTTTATTTTVGEYYVIKSGDTLGSVAAKYDTTVEEVMALNPGFDPTSLHIGQRIRVG
jgi:LysM repeat protein